MSYAVELSSETSEVFEDSYVGQIRPQWGNFCDKDYAQDFRSLNCVTSIPSSFRLAQALATSLTVGWVEWLHLSFSSVSLLGFAKILR